MFKAAAFGNILSDKTVNVFIESSLPGAVGMTEVVVAFELLGNALMSGEFQPVIGGDGMDSLLMRTQQAYDLTGDQFRCFSAGNRELEVHRFSLDDRDDGSLPSFADNRIDLEVSQSFFVLYNAWSVIDADPVCNAAFAAGTVLDPPFPPVAQLLIQIALVQPVDIDVFVDGDMGDIYIVFQCKRGGYLFGRVLQRKISGDQFYGLFGEFEVCFL